MPRLHQWNGSKTTGLSLVLYAVNFANLLLVLATAEQPLEELPVAIADSLGPCVDFHAPLSGQRAHFFAPLLQEMREAPVDGAADVPEPDALVRLGGVAVRLVLTCPALMAQRTPRTAEVGTDASVNSSLQSGTQPLSTESSRARRRGRSMSPWRPYGVCERRAGGLYWRLYRCHGR